MKVRLLLIGGMLLALFSCEVIIDNFTDNLFNRDTTSCRDPLETYVTSIDGSHRVKAGEGLHLKVEIALSPCSEYLRFEDETDGNTTFYTPLVCGDCDGRKRITSVNLIVKKDIPGSYKLYFKGVGNTYEEFKFVVE